MNWMNSMKRKANTRSQAKKQKEALEGQKHTSTASSFTEGKTSQDIESLQVPVPEHKGLQVMVVPRRPSNPSPSPNSIKFFNNQVEVSESEAWSILEDESNWSTFVEDGSQKYSKLNTNLKRKPTTDEPPKKATKTAKTENAKWNHLILGDLAPSAPKAAPKAPLVPESVSSAPQKRREEPQETTSVPSQGEELSEEEDIIAAYQTFGEEEHAFRFELGKEVKRNDALAGLKREVEQHTLDIEAIERELEEMKKSVEGLHNMFEGPSTKRS